MIPIRLPIIAVLLAGSQALGQTAAPKPQPTPEELAFERLPVEVRQMLRHMPPTEAMQTVARAGQHAIALGNPYPSAEQFRGTLGALLSGPSSTYTSASAGQTTFPPLSPLVPPPPPPFLR